MLTHNSIPDSANFQPGFTFTSYQCRDALLQWYMRERHLPEQLRLRPDLLKRVGDVLNRPSHETDEPTWLALRGETQRPFIPSRRRSADKHARWKQLREQGYSWANIKQTHLDETGEEVSERAITKAVKGK
jgi:hypothetical protein